MFTIIIIIIRCIMIMLGGLDIVAVHPLQPVLVEVDRARQEDDASPVVRS